MKLGVTLKELSIEPAPYDNIILNKERELYASKTIVLSALAVYFDIYDETFLKKVPQELLI